MFKKLIKSLERTGNERLRAYLLGMPDDFLLEHGYSRAQLNRGVEAWPWSFEDKPAAPSATIVPVCTEAKMQQQPEPEQPQEVSESLDRVA